jgi:NAD(P)-dependent dehydrogenase (short-subunit alcohol dehydrogenase family)
MKNQKIALVTGANKGIGFEIARELARMSWRVFLGARNEKAGRAAAEKLASEGEVIFLEIDVSDPESIRRAAEEFSRQEKHLDVLINNAGILLDDEKDALAITPEVFEQTLRTNTLGPWLVAQAFVPLLKKSSAPRIVNVSSGSGQLEDGADGWAPGYSVSKTALNGAPTWAAKMPPAPSAKALPPSSG